jgi:hypothetical protein
MSDKDLTTDILSKIQTTTPRSRGYFLARNIGFFLIMVGLIILGSISLGSFWIDTREFVIPTTGVGLNIWSVLSEAAFELILLGFVVAGVAYLIYRQTDWFMVRNKGVLATGFVLAILVGALLYVSVYTVASRDLPNQRDVIDRSVIRTRRHPGGRQNLPMAGEYTGVVEKNERDKFEIKTPQSRLRFAVIRPIPGQESIQRGDTVTIRVDHNNVVTEIKKMP